MQQKITLKTFGDFISLEESERPVDTFVLTFGRFNPPTTGHEKLIQKVKEVAGTHTKMGQKVRSCVYVSRLQDHKKNPLSLTDKIRYLHLMSGNQTILPVPEVPDTSGFFAILKNLDKNGFNSEKVHNVIVVVGSDRVKELSSKLSSYNGKLYNFQSINIVSAGERDPDDDTSPAGMSGTKMRVAAIAMDLNKFRSGISKSISDTDAHEMMRKVRAGMSISESFQKEQVSVLEEGVNDPAIFKCVFLLGGTGSGKDFILSKVLNGHGFIESNPDFALEYFMKQEKLDKKMPDSEAEKRYVVRARATDATLRKRNMTFENRLGIIIPGTGYNYEFIRDIKHHVESIGYECKCIFVSTSNEISKARNIERGDLGGRTVPEEIRQKKWQDAIQNREKYRRLFGAENYIEIDNSLDLRSIGKTDHEKINKVNELKSVFVKMRKFAQKPPSSSIARQWIEDHKKHVKKMNEEFTSEFPIDVNTLFEYSLFDNIPFVTKKHKKKKKKHEPNRAFIPVIMMKNKKKKLESAK